MNIDISIIIRTKNEERWITQCLSAVLSQDVENFEIIIVDNESDDKTIEKVEQFRGRLQGRLKIIKCEEYLPGKAINMGIKKSRGKFIVCLSGHCLPVGHKWLSSLLKTFEENDTSIAGVYGRQQPMSFTSDSDKRDLMLLFGLDKKIQIKDSFFHNANSMIRREIWDIVPFDEKATNIEDRIWAQKVIEKGYTIAYAPDASVYHYHGIHQNGNAERLTNVVRILENLHEGYSGKSIEAENLNIVCIIPIIGKIRHLKGRPLIEYTIRRALESKYIKKTIVSTDNDEMAELARKLKAETPFIRDPYLSKEEVDLRQVLSYSLKKLEENKLFPDLIVSLEPTFPFRPKNLIDAMIAELAEKGFDAVMAARKENKGLWKEEKDVGMKQIDEGFTPRKFKDPTLIELRGLGMVIHPEFLRNGRPLAGQKTGLYEVNNPYSGIEVRSEDDFKLASSLIDVWFK